MGHMRYSASAPCSTSTSPSGSQNLETEVRSFFHSKTFSLKCILLLVHCAVLCTAVHPTYSLAVLLVWL